jgi:hypothetical protein
VLTDRRLWEKTLPGAASRLVVPIESMELSRWQDGYGAIFANPGDKQIYC